MTLDGVSVGIGLLLTQPLRGIEVSSPVKM